MKRRRPLVPVVIALLMVSSAALAVILKPHERLAEELPKSGVTVAIKPDLG